MSQLVRIHLQCRRPGFDPWLGKIPWRRESLPIPVFWPGEFQGLYSSWGRKESDTTEWLSLHFTSHSKQLFYWCCQLLIQISTCHLPLQGWNHVPSWRKSPSEEIDDQKFSQAFLKITRKSFNWRLMLRGWSGHWWRLSPSRCVDLMLFKLGTQEGREHARPLLNTLWWVYKKPWSSRTWRIFYVLPQ